MQISYQSLGRGIVLKLKGRLDLEHVSRLTAEVRDAMVYKPAFIILNMIDVLDLAQMTDVFAIYRSDEEALKELDA